VEDLEQRAVEVFDHVVVGGEAFVDEFVQVLSDRLPTVPVCDAQIANCVLGEAIKPLPECLVVDLLPHGQQPGRRSGLVKFDFSIYWFDYVGVAFRASKRLLAGRQTLATDAGPLRPAKAAIDARGKGHPAAK